MTFSVTVSDHIMIAHSLRGAEFGPAQALHGATYVVEATFSSPELGPNGTVIDMTVAADALRTVLADLGYRNLDDLDQFAGLNTTTEVLARYIADRLVDHLANSVMGTAGGQVNALEVVLQESPSARAGYVRRV